MAAAKWAEQDRRNFFADNACRRKNAEERKRQRMEWDLQREIKAKERFRKEAERARKIEEEERVKKEEEAERRKHMFFKIGATQRNFVSKLQNQVKRKDAVQARAFLLFLHTLSTRHPYLNRVARRVAVCLDFGGSFAKLFPRPIIWRLENYMSGLPYPPLLIHPYFATQLIDGESAREAVRQHIGVSVKPVLWTRNTGELDDRYKVTDATFPAQQVRDFPAKLFVVIPTFTIGNFLERQVWGQNAPIYISASASECMDCNPALSSCGQTMAFAINDSCDIVVFQTSSECEVLGRANLRMPLSVVRLAKSLHIQIFPKKIVLAVFSACGPSTLTAYWRPDFKAQETVEGGAKTLTHIWPLTQHGHRENREVLDAFVPSCKPLYYKVLSIEPIHIVWMDLEAAPPKEGAGCRVPGHRLDVYEMNPAVHGKEPVKTVEHVSQYPGNNTLGVSEDGTWVAYGGSSHLIEILKLDWNGAFHEVCASTAIGVQGCGRLRALSFCPFDDESDAQVLAVSGNKGIAVHYLDFRTGCEVAVATFACNAQCVQIVWTGSSSFVALSKSKRRLFWFSIGVRAAGDAGGGTLRKDRSWYTNNKVKYIIGDPNNIVLCVYGSHIELADGKPRR